MLKQGDGTLVCVAEDQERFTLGQVKEELLISLGLNTEEEGSTLQFLRRGYKVSDPILPSLQALVQSKDDEAYRSGLHCVCLSRQVLA